MLAISLRWTKTIAARARKSKPTNERQNAGHDPKIMAGVAEVEGSSQNVP
jgi:hypothetical protein